MAAVAARDVPETEHPVPVVAKPTAPLPEPPTVVKVIGVPTVSVKVVLVIVSVA